MFSSRLKNDRTDDLVWALLSLETEEDCYRLFEDLFTIREIQDLAQRLEAVSYTHLDVYKRQDSSI